MRKGRAQRAQYQLTRLCAERLHDTEKRSAAVDGAWHALLEGYPRLTADQYHHIRSLCEAFYASGKRLGCK